MSRDPRYQKLLNSKRWKVLRASYLRIHQNCERCEAEGYITPAVDVHHKTPVETATTALEMERLAYSVDNLQALCIPCHVKTHKEMGKSTRVNHIQRTNQALQRWIKRHEQKNGDQSPTPTDSMK